MTPHQTVAVAVRLFAIWLLLNFGRNIFAFYNSTGIGERTGTLLLCLAAFLIACVVSALLWAFPLTVARKLLPSAASEPAPPAAPEAWLAVGAAAIGLWVISSAAPLLFRDLLLQHFYPREFESSGFISYVVRSVAELVVAVWLICGARGVIKLFRWARTAGTSKVL